MDATATVLFGKTRQAVLTLLLEQPERRYYLREMARLIGAGPSVLQHEMTELQKADLVTRTKDGNRVSYQANVHHPVFAELQSMISKTCGLPAQLKNALQPLAARIRFAAIYGSLAKGADHARSDVDLLIVGELALEQVVDAVSPLEDRLARQISVRLYSPTEYRQRKKRKGDFVQAVMAGPLNWIVGAADDA